MSKSRTLFFVAEGTNTSGELERVWVYKQGGSYYLSGSGVSSKEHLCHPSVKDRAGIQREIFLVFQVKVEKTIEPYELGQQSGGDA
jgi:hypothetical protein